MTAAFFSNLGPAHRPQTRPALAGLPLHSCSRVTTLGSRRFWTSGPQSGSYLSVPSSLMAIGLDIRRPAKEDFMSFSVLHGIGSEVIPAHLPVTPASQADVGA